MRQGSVPMGRAMARGSVGGYEGWSGIHTLEAAGGKHDFTEGTGVATETFPGVVGPPQA